MPLTASAMRDAFAARFDAEPEVVVRAPGRVNLIGEHTDTSDGWVLPAAIDRATWVAARRVSGPTTLESREQGPGTPFDASRSEPGQVPGWAQYPAGVAWALRYQGFDVPPDVEAFVASDVPAGAGLSSSAALEVGFLHVWNSVAGLGLTPREVAELARFAENRFVGVACGIMDPLASALGQAGHALLVDTRTLDVEAIPMPDHWSLMVCDTGVSRALAGSAYNERRLQVEQAAHELGVATLRDATPSLVEGAASRLGEVLTRRARHVTTENERVHTLAAALARADGDAVRRAMRASHQSLRDDFEVSCPELDAMAAAAWEAPGCVGARMVGAGFGGACLAILESDSEQRFEEHVARVYAEKTGRQGRYLGVTPAAGAAVVHADLRGAS